MSRTKFGDVTAYFPPADGDSKGGSRKIGCAFKDEQGYISFVIDTLPLPGSSWKGWCNIQPITSKNKPAKTQTDYDDDTPF